jgi:hypothetical protein
LLTGRYSPGSAVDKKNGIKLIAECINQAHKETESVKVVLENSAGGTNSIGTTFEDLKGIIDHVSGISTKETSNVRSIESRGLYRYVSCLCCRYSISISGTNLRLRFEDEGCL